MMANKGITVKELLRDCEYEVSKGNGDKYIIISSDDEGNSYHTLFYGFTDTEKDIQYCLDREQDGTHTIEDTIALG